MGGYLATPTVINQPANAYTGWAQYTDATYNQASPFVLTADTKVKLPNFGSKLAPQMPTDILDFYDPSTQKVLGRLGDSMGLGIEFKIVPNTVSASLVTVNIDIAGTVNEIYPVSFIMDKGVGVVHSAYFPLLVYTLDTWETNGGDIDIVCNGPANVYGIRYVFHRFHKAR